MEYSLAGHYGHRRLLRSCIPLVLMMIVSSVYSIVDGLFVANFAGTTAFASINLVWPSIMVIGAVGIMVGTGGSALVSKTMGEGQYDRAREYFSMLVKVIVLFGAVMVIPLVLLMPLIVRLLGADDIMSPVATLYGRVCVMGLPFFMMQMAFQPFFMTAEKPQLGMVMSVGSGLANILLDALLVYYLEMGVLGAALATITSQMLGGLYPLLFFLRKDNGSPLRLIRCRLELRPVLASCQNGLSEYVSQISLSVVSICYNLQLMRYIGQDGVSTYGVLMYVGFIYVAMFVGFNMTIAPVVGYNYGAGNKAELRSLLRHGLLIVFLAGCMMSLVSFLTAGVASALFVGYDPGLMQMTKHAMRLYMCSFVVVGVNLLTSAWFTALSNGTVSAFSSFTRTMVFELASVFILPLVLGIDGIWASVIVADVMAFILSVILLLRYRRRYGY